MVADEAQEPKKKSGMFKWLIIILLLMILSVGGFIAYKMFMSSPSSSPDTPKVAENGETEEPEGDPDAPLPELEYLQATLPTFLVNLKDPLGRRYLKLTMELEVVDEDTIEAIRSLEAKVVDSVIMLLSSKTYAELSTLESKMTLKKDLIREINRILGGPRVKQIYFTELVIQ